jgi:hypothetical protein
MNYVDPGLNRFVAANSPDTAIFYIGHQNEMNNYVMLREKMANNAGMNTM